MSLNDLQELLVILNYPHHSYIGTLNNSNLFVEVVVMNVEQIQSSFGLTYKKMTSDFKS